MNLQEEYAKTNEDLIRLKVELLLFNLDVNLKKSHKGLIDVLDRIERHTNEQRRLVRVQTKFLWHILQLGNKEGSYYNKEVMDGFWKELRSI